MYSFLHKMKILWTACRALHIKKYIYIAVAGGGEMISIKQKKKRGPRVRSQYIGNVLENTRVCHVSTQTSFYFSNNNYEYSFSSREVIYL